jgi:hypothetical protein
MRGTTVPAGANPRGPSGAAAIPNALVVGLRTILKFLSMAKTRLAAAGRLPVLVRPSHKGEIRHTTAALNYTIYCALVVSFPYFIAAGTQQRRSFMKSHGPRSVAALALPDGEMLGMGRQESGSNTVVADR